jgi:cytoskeletal protein CcmA (bactofilin family)
LTAIPFNALVLIDGKQVSLLDTMYAENLLDVNRLIFADPSADGSLIEGIIFPTTSWGNIRLNTIDGAAVLDLLGHSDSSDFTLKLSNSGSENFNLDVGGTLDVSGATDIGGAVDIGGTLAVGGTVDVNDSNIINVAGIITNATAVLEDNNNFETSLTPTSAIGTWSVIQALEWWTRNNTAVVAQGTWRASHPGASYGDGETIRFTFGSPTSLTEMKLYSYWVSGGPGNDAGDVIEFYDELDVLLKSVNVYNDLNDDNANLQTITLGVGSISYFQFTVPVGSSGGGWAIDDVTVYYTGRADLAITADTININSDVDLRGDLDLNANSLIVDSGGNKTITAAELAYLDGLNQLLTSTSSPTFDAVTATSIIISGNTITTAEWANLDGLNQTLASTSSPTFAAITVTGNVDGRDVSVDGTKLDTIEESAKDDQAVSELTDAVITDLTDNELLQYDSGTSKWINQTLTEAGIAAAAHAMADHTDENTYNISTSGTAATGALTVTGNISVTGTVDGIDVATHAGNASAHHVKYVLTDDLAAGEITQLQAIGDVTINVTQWGYLGALDQSLVQAASPTFAGLTLGGNIVSTASRNIQLNNAAADTLLTLENTDATYKANLDVEGNIVVGGTVDGTDISVHVGNASAHHAKYTTAEAEAVITAELVNGQSIDNAIDALIGTHAGLASAHHTKYVLTDDLAAGEITQLQNIGAITISLAQWTVLGGLAGTLTNTELNYVDGVTSAIQTQFTGKSPVAGSSSIVTVGTLTGGSILQVRATDDRDYKPNTSSTYRMLRTYFTSLGGMTGVANSDYQDLLIINSYMDASGGDINALTFDKSTKLIKHWLADQAAATWGIPKTIAYTDTDHGALTGKDDDDHSAIYYNKTAVDAKISDTVYGVGWNGVTTIAPSKNAVYDKIEALGAGGDDLGNHTATQDLAMATFAITGVGNVDGVDVSALKTDVDNFPDALQSVTASAAEINKLDGLLTTKTELGYVDGVSSAIQTQLDGKAVTSHTMSSHSDETTYNISTSGTFAFGAAAEDLDMGAYGITVADANNYALQVGAHNWGVYIDGTNNYIHLRGYTQVRLDVQTTNVLYATSTEVYLPVGVSVTGNIAVTGTVDGVDIAARDHAPDNLGNHTASETLKMGAHAIVGTDQQHRILLDPVADEMHFYPGDEAADYHVIFKSTSATDASPIVMPSVNEKGYLGINTQRWYYVHTRAISISGKAVSNIHDEDDMASDDNVALATQQSIKAYVDDANMIGTANKRWVNGSHVLHCHGTQMTRGTNGYAPDADTNSFLGTILSMPYTWGTKTLRCDRVRVVLNDADGSNYLDEIRFLCTVQSGNTNKFPTGYTTNRTVAGTWEYAVTAFDCSSYDLVQLRAYIQVATKASITITTLQLRVWYE